MTNRLIDEQVQEIRELHALSNPAKWFKYFVTETGWTIQVPNGFLFIADPRANQDDVNFVVAAHATAPALCTELIALRADLKAASEREMKVVQTLAHQVKDGDDKTSDQLAEMIVAERDSLAKENGELKKDRITTNIMIRVWCNEGFEKCLRRKGNTVFADYIRDIRQDSPALVQQKAGDADEK